MLAAGLHPGLVQNAREMLSHYAMEVHSPPRAQCGRSPAGPQGPHLDPGDVRGWHSRRLDHPGQAARQESQLPYTILVGQVKDEAAQRKLLLAGISDWVPLPLSAEKHVIICGYGRSGQNLARMLDTQHIPYMALDLDPDRVRQAAAAGQSVVFGDAARLQSLMAAGLVRANAVVVSYPDTPSALKILRLVRQHAPSVPVIVRTIDDSDLETLRNAGATEVVPEAIEGSLMLASHALALVGVPMRKVIRLTRDARDARYGLLRGYFHGADDDTVEELQQARLASVTLPAGRCLHRQVAGRPGAACGGRQRGVGAAGLGAVTPARDDTVLGAGDTLVISGLPEPLALAEEKLLRG